MSSNHPKKPVKINRENLSAGILQTLAAERATQPVKLLSEQELKESRRLYVSDTYSGNDIWIFGYGSLIWNPSFNFNARKQAHLFGYHRRFCLRTTITRGSPEKPGLVLGLDRGGSARGIIFRMPASIAASECDVIWKREMLNGAYTPSWVKVRADDGTQKKALTFVIRREHPSFAAPLPDNQSSKIIAEASGIIGANSEYLYNTEAALAAEGIHDSTLKRLVKLVTMHNQGQT
ncbi:gamma-glutamylcyclotransferase [Alphaproteobacteria bacterium]|nr:gamma-glutamylcyclotransferase [Alphaproteobacteria bacterium]